MLGYGTIVTDIKGWFNLLFAKKPEGKIWICVGNHNRSRPLLDWLVASLPVIKYNSEIGLSVFDCDSDDIPGLQNEIKKKWSGDLIFSSEKIKFSRALAFNRAMRQAPGDWIFVADADISLPVNFVQLYRKNVRKNVAWFPVTEYELDEKGENWKWYEGGTGIFGAYKNALEGVGYYDEKFTEWGKEDWDLLFRFYKSGVSPLRSRVKGLRHHWHSSSQPENYQKWF
jgi:glycosyltransferase involved in cell wall biosynthesis